MKLFTKKDRGLMEPVFSIANDWQFGHSIHPPPTDEIPIGATGLWSKRVEEGPYTKFFIHVDVWEHRYEKPLKVTYAPTARLYLPDESYIDVSIESKETLDLGTVEVFYLGLYETLRCIPDIHNQRY